MTLTVVRKLYDQLRRELQSSPKLRYGLLALGVLALGEAGLRWTDRLTEAENRLQSLYGELRTLRAQGRDETALRQSVAAMQEARRIVDERLWVVSSDATGQARMKDWLAATLKQAGVSQATTVLSAARPYAALAATAAGNRPPAGETSTTGAPPAGDGGLREIRATVTTALTPALLEQLLAGIEGGAPLAAVEALTVSRRDRRIELTVRVLFRIMRPAAVGDAGGRP